MRFGAIFICVFAAMARTTLESCFNILLINLHGLEGPQLGNAMRWFEWFLLAILGAVIAVAPEATRAAEPDSMLSLPKSREPDPADAPDGNIIARHTSAEPGALAPDLFMLSKGKAANDARSVNKIGASGPVSAPSPGSALGPTETLRSAPRLMQIGDQLDGSKVISSAFAKSELFTSAARLRAVQVATSPASTDSAPGPNGDLPPSRPALAAVLQSGPGTAVKAPGSDTPSDGALALGASFRAAEPLRVTPRSAPHDAVMRDARIDAGVATHLVPDIHVSAPASADDAQLAVAQVLGPSFRTAADLKRAFQVRPFDRSEAVLTTAALNSVLLTSAVSPLDPPAADAGQSGSATRVSAPTTTPVRATPSATALAAPMIDARSVILKPLLVSQPVVAADVPERAFRSASALRSAFQLTSPEVLIATERVGLPAQGELISPPTPVVDVASMTGSEAAPVMLMSMIAAPPVPEEPIADTGLRSTGPQSSSNVSAPDPLWLRKNTTPAKVLTVASCKVRAMD